MGFEDKNFENILEEMKEWVTSHYDVDVSEGSIIHDALSPSAFQFMQMYMYLQGAIDNAYGDTANEEYLVRLAKERGLERYPATNSYVVADIPNIKIDIIGEEFKSSDGVIYTVTKNLPVDTEYELRCETPGSIGNNINISLKPTYNITGFRTCTVVRNSILGQDQEDLEVFRKRYLRSFNTQRFGGNKTDYIDKVMSIDGVGSCTVVPARLSSTGSVNDITVYVRGEDYTVATTELVQKVQKELDPLKDGMGDGWCPIGHRCYVKASEKVDMDLKLKIRTRSKSIDTTTLRNECKQVLQKWLKEKFKDVYDEVKYIYDSDIVKVLKTEIDEITDVDVEFGTTYEPDYSYKDLIKIDSNKFPVCESISVSLITTQTGW